MAITTFKPTVWSANLLVALQKALVSSEFYNKDYEALVPGARTVKINTLSDVTVKDYSGSVTWEDLTTADQDMVLDFIKYVAFAVDDVDKVQAASGGELMRKATERAAYQIADAIDAKNFATLVAGAGTKLGTDAAPKAITTADDAKALLLELNKEASKHNVPKQGRKVAVTPEFSALLAGDKYLGLSDPTAQQALGNGYVGRIFGLDIYETNNIAFKEVTPSGGGAKYDVTNVILSHQMGATFASQLEEMEAMRLQDSFKDGVRCLSVTGRKVTRPECVISATVKY